MAFYSEISEKFKTAQGIYRWNYLKPYLGLIGIGLVIRIVLSPFWGSHFLDDLFLPFLNHWVKDGGNPYQFFWQSGFKDAFPYPPVMLWFIGGPAKVLNFLFSVNPSEWQIEAQRLLYRIPLVLADFSVFLVLSSWLKDKVKWLIFSYWFSPLVIYICYLHGQLDVVPVALLVWAFYFLFKEKFWQASLLIGLSLATKSTAVICIPYVILFFITRFQGYFKSLIWLIFIAIIGFSPALLYPEAEGIGPMVYQNNQQAKLFAASVNFGNGLSLYLIPVVWLLLFIRALSFRLFNKELFLLFTGFSLGVIILLIPPMPGWYFWLIPFWVYFLVKYPNNSKGLWGALTLAYFLYFFTSQNSDLQYWGLVSAEKHHSFLTNLSFTVLQTLLLVSCYLIYYKGVSHNLKLKLWYQPFLLGVGGDSGSGKSTFGFWLEQLLGLNLISIVKGDDMHKWERGDLNWQNFTHLNPKANFLHREADFAQQLSKGHKIWRRVYDHQSGRFLEPQAIIPKRLLLFEGLHPFYLERVRNLYDLRIFLKPDETLRREWKTNRDKAERGYTNETSLQQIDSRLPDSEKFIWTQGAYADCIIQFFKNEKTSELSLKLEVRNKFEMDNLLEIWTNLGFTHFIHSYLENDFQVLEINSAPSKVLIEKMAIYLVPDLEELTLGKAQWLNGYSGLIQLITAWLIFETMKLENDA